MKIRSVAIMLAASLLVGAVGFPQAAAAADAAPSAGASKRSLDAALRRGVVDEIAKLMTDEYVFPDVGLRAANALSQHLAAGDYGAITDPGTFARRLTEDLNTVAHDKHLRVRSDEQGSGQKGQVTKRPPAEAGFTRVDVLGENIGYLDLSGFVGKAMFKPVADKAMRLLAGTDALILDLRANGGGQPAAVSYLVSFFVDSQKSPVHVNDQLKRKPGTDEYRRDVFQTEATPVSYFGKPVVILMGPGTFSAGEEFAYDMQGLKLATLVGEVTGGGANPGGTRQLPAGLSIFVPTGRSENPITHTNWEGRGVEPDVAAASDQAFAKAYETARKAAGKDPLAFANASSSPDAVMERALLRPRTTALPGNEAVLRRSIAELQAGAPRYDLLSPGLAKLIREQLSQIHDELAAFGTLQSVSFLEIGALGEDVYELKFSKAELLWGILLDGEGRIAMMDWHPK